LALAAGLDRTFGGRLARVDGLGEPGWAVPGGDPQPLARGHRPDERKRLRQAGPVAHPVRLLGRGDAGERFPRELREQRGAARIGRLAQPHRDIVETFALNPLRQTVASFGDDVLRQDAAARSEAGRLKITAADEEGRHVLLWWKAWDPEGLPPELCIRTPDGVPVAVDPTNPAARDELARQLTAMLRTEGLDADGLKVDFTARTPSGRALTAHGAGWGIALLHELLDVVYRSAKAVKPEALIITQAPHPAFARNAQGEYVYHNMKREDVAGKCGPGAEGCRGADLPEHLVAGTAVDCRDG